MTDDNLHCGKIYLVTGAGRGIGKAVVAKLDDLGAKVYALSKNPDNLSKLKEEHPNIITICADLSDWNATKSNLEKLEAVDCVINNAGILITSDFFSVKPDDIDSMVNVNLKGVINVSQVMTRKMIETGKSGSVVNISSVVATKASAATHSVFYACAKAALEMLGKIMAITLGPHKIRVNTVCPGIVQTDMLAESFQAITENKGLDCVNQLHALLDQQTYSGQVVTQMDEVVNTILFMASGAATQITGQILRIDGGLSIA